MSAGFVETKPEAMLAVNAVKQTPSFTEQTRGQVAAWGNTTRNEGYGVRNPFLAPLLKECAENSSAFYRKVRHMRKQPTIRLTRQLSVAVMAEAEWSVEGEEDVDPIVKEYVEKHIMPLRDAFMGSALRGTFDFGWQPFEKIFAFDMDAMQIVPQKLKPLLQDQTDIVIKTDTGGFAGLKQYMTYLAPQNVLLINRDVEGTYFYGEGAMASIEQAYMRWLVTDESNVRYDNKICGAHWVIHFPEGQSTYQGRSQDNSVIANDLLNALRGSGSITVPNTLQAALTDLNGHSTDTAWKIELMSAQPGQQAEFQGRLAYLDTLMVRAGGFPERSILEGQYGTKAEAEAHADFGVGRMDYENKQIINQFNKYFVNQLIALNFGKDAVGKVKIKIAPIADDKIAMLKQVYLAALANPTVSGAEFQAISMTALRDQVGIPSKSQSELDALNAQQNGTGPDFSNGTGMHGGNDPMLQQFLAHLNTSDQQQGAAMPPIGSAV